MNERYKRLIALTRFLSENPFEQVSLTDLSQRLGVAKSTLSEDLLLVKESFDEHGIGSIATQVGAQGGIVFVPQIPKKLVARTLNRWCRELMQPDRMTPDGFLYMTDLLFNPRMVDSMGLLLAERFRRIGIDFVATVETKGIPLALSCSRYLGIELVLLRRDNRLSEGSSLSINYLSGSSRRVQSLSLARRSPVRGGRVLFVDDFMRAGGTARAATDLLSEVEARVVGVGVLIATTDPRHKLIDDYSSCLRWESGDQSNGRVFASEWAQDIVQE